MRVGSRVRLTEGFARCLAKRARKRGRQSVDWLARRGTVRMLPEYVGVGVSVVWDGTKYDDRLPMKVLEEVEG